MDDISDHGSLARVYPLSKIESVSMNSIMQATRPPPAGGIYRGGAFLESIEETHTCASRSTI